jgi:hypothetical protein
MQMSDPRILLSRRVFLDPPGTSNPDYLVAECVEHTFYQGARHISVELAYRGQEVYLPFSTDADRARSLDKLDALITNLEELRRVLQKAQVERPVIGNWYGEPTETQTRLGGKV